MLALAIVAAIIALTSLALPLYLGLAAKNHTTGAADAAALAAADVAVGIVPGIPCERAAAVATANGVSIDSCDADGLIVTVAVSTTVLGIPVRAVATAGPP